MASNGTAVEAESLKISKTDQLRAYTEAVNAAREIVIVLNAGNLRGYWEIGQRVGEVLGTTRDADGELVENAANGRAKYGERSVEQFAADVGMSNTGAYSAFSFFRYVPHDVLDQMCSVVSDGKPIFSWRRVQRDLLTMFNTNAAETLAEVRKAVATATAASKFVKQIEGKGRQRRPLRKTPLDFFKSMSKRADGLVEFGNSAVDMLERYSKLASSKGGAEAASATREELVVMQKRLNAAVIALTRILNSVKKAL